MGIICFLTYSETYAPVLLEWKTKKLRKETGNPDLFAKGARQLPISGVLKRAIQRPVKMFLFCPVVTGLAIYNAVVYGFTYLLFSTFSVVFEGQYTFDDGLAWSCISRSRDWISDLIEYCKLCERQDSPKTHS